VVGPGMGGLAGCVRLRTADRSNQGIGGGGGSAQESGHRRVGGGRWALRDAQRAEVGIGGSEMFGYGQGFSFWSRRQAARSGVAGPIMPTAGIPTRTLSTQLGGLLGKICCSDRGGAVLRIWRRAQPVAAAAERRHKRRARVGLRGSSSSWLWSPELLSQARAARQTHVWYPAAAVAWCGVVCVWWVSACRDVVCRRLCMCAQ